MTEQHLCSLNDHLRAQINELGANADQISNPRCHMPVDGEGLDLSLKIFILAMKIQDINWEEKGEQGGEE